MIKAESRGILQAVSRVFGDQFLTELTDQELLGRFVAGRDEAAFHALLRRHGPAVLNVCRSLLPNEADAEDAFQATFLILAHKSATIRQIASLGSWLHGVAYRTARKAQADFAKRRKHEALAVRPEASLPEDLSWREVQRVVHEELAGLTERARAPLLLHYLEGKTLDEAAARLGLSKGTLKARLERARQVLRARLIRRGLGSAGVLLAAAWPASGTASLPLGLLDSTVKTAIRVGAGQAAAELVSARVAALAGGLQNAMFTTKLKAVAALLSVFAFVGLGLGGLARQAPADRGPAEPSAKFKPVEGKPKVTRDLVKDRHNEKWARIEGKAKVIDARTLEFADGTRIHLNYVTPALEQMGKVNGSLYPCGKEAAEFLRRLIGDQPVTCYGTETRNENGWIASVGDTALDRAMILNGWALASQRPQQAAEFPARERKRGLWRGEFVDPIDWEAGARLPGETPPAKLADLRQAQRLIGTHGKREASLKSLVTRIVHDLPYARQLSFEGVGITDDQLRQLTALKSLESLDLFSCLQITDAGLAHLMEFPHLKSLRASVYTTDAGLKHVGKLKELEQLMVGHWLSNAITDAGLSHLEGLHGLRYLTLYNLRTTDDGLLNLRALKNLVVLEFGKVRVTNLGLPHLSGLSNLEFLDISDTEVTDAGVEHLIGLKKLRVLKLPDQVSAKARHRLSEAIPGLKFDGKPEDVMPAEGSRRN